MSSFDKFMKDLEDRQQKKKEQSARLQRDDQAHNFKRRITHYAERWQNSIKFKRGKK